MQAARFFSNTFLNSALFRSLRNTWQHHLPHLLHPVDNNLNQPLLDQPEILDLRRRIQSRKQKSLPNNFDTANPRTGDARSVYRGYGMDYEESRPYQNGDDPRYMNWKLTARTGELHMKVFREERRPGVFILVDRRASMRFGTHTRLKAAQAARVATCITFAALQRHASVGGAIINTDADRPRWMRESDDEQDAFAFIHAASAACPPERRASTLIQNEPQLNEVLSTLHALITPGTQLYLISDFIDLTEQHRAQLLQLAAENPVHAIQIIDPTEQYLPQIGTAQFCTTKKGAPFLFNTNSSDVQKKYCTAVEKHFTEHEQLFRSLGISHTLISSTDEPVETLLSEI